MTKLSIKIDVNKIDKNRLELRSYKNKDGETITVKDMDLDVIIMDEDRHKILKAGDTWELVNVGFVTQKATKKEVEDKVKMSVIGSVTRFKDKVSVPKFERDSQGKPIGVNEPVVEINPEDIPF